MRFARKGALESCARPHWAFPSNFAKSGRPRIAAMGQIRKQFAALCKGVFLDETAKTRETCLRMATKANSFEGRRQRTVSFEIRKT